MREMIDDLAIRMALKLTSVRVRKKESFEKLLFYKIFNFLEIFVKFSGIFSYFLCFFEFSRIKKTQQNFTKQMKTPKFFRPKIMENFTNCRKLKNAPNFQNFIKKVNFEKLLFFRTLTSVEDELAKVPPEKQSCFKQFMLKIFNLEM